MKVSLFINSALIPALFLALPAAYHPVNHSADQILKVHDQILQHPLEKKELLADDLVIEKAEEEAPSIQKLLKTSMIPVGQTLYVWGGGWNEEDTAGGIESMTIGPSEQWAEFYQSQDEGYNFQNTVYQIHDGLDCSGFIGWSLYNTFYERNNEDNMVVLSGDFGHMLSSRGYGDVYSPSEISEYTAGDIMFNNGHIYMILGQYEDGSLLLVHSAPPGVRISGTPDFDGNSESMAVQKARMLMETYFSDFYSRYPKVLVESSYLTDYSQFVWNEATMPDRKLMESLTPDQVIDLIFK